jgi:hypothetical protein
MRVLALLRERFGFTVAESLAMTPAEFEEWLEALNDSKENETNESEACVNVPSGQCIDPSSIRQRIQKHLSNS